MVWHHYNEEARIAELTPKEYFIEVNKSATHNIHDLAITDLEKIGVLQQEIQLKKPYLDVSIFNKIKNCIITFIAGIVVFPIVYLIWTFVAFVTFIPINAIIESAWTNWMKLYIMPFIFSFFVSGAISYGMVLPKIQDEVLGSNAKYFDALNYNKLVQLSKETNSYNRTYNNSSHSTTRNNPSSRPQLNDSYNNIIVQRYREKKLRDGQRINQTNAQITYMIGSTFEKNGKLASIRNKYPEFYSQYLELKKLVKQK